VGRLITASVLLAALLLCSCAPIRPAVSVNVPQPLRDRPKVAALQIERALFIEDSRDHHSIPIAYSSETAQFRFLLGNYLLGGEKPRFEEGPDMTITASVLDFDGGDFCYLIGCAAGKGRIAVEIAFRARDGHDLGKINVRGVGLISRDPDMNIVRLAAKRAADFIISNFATGTASGG
jgi:hypothetical protein